MRPGKPLSQAISVVRSSHVVRSEAATVKKSPSASIVTLRASASVKVATRSRVVLRQPRV
ncbi:MAG TPA: hypothetical protein DEF51_43355 [Myxococcales bacterium]|nr:hypothetical protein [Myxococcales bacterium]